MSDGMRPFIKCLHCGTYNEADPELATCWKCGKLLVAPERQAPDIKPDPETQIKVFIW